MFGLDMSEITKAAEEGAKLTEDTNKTLHKISDQLEVLIKLAEEVKELLGKD